MRSPTELTMETSVMKGVQKALQRARRRSSLSSSKLFFGNGLSTIFDQDWKLLYGFLNRFAKWSIAWYIMSTRLKSNKRVSRPQISLVNRTNSITRKHHAQEEPRHRHPSPLMPDEHYRRPELHIHQDEEVIHEVDRFRIRRAGVQLFSPPRMTARMEQQLNVMDRAGVDQAALHVGVWLDWVDIKAARLINDRLAELNLKYPGRIIPPAHVPPLDHDAGKELKRAIVHFGV